MLKVLPVAAGFMAAVLVTPVSAQSLSTTFAGGNSLNAPGHNHFDITVTLPMLITAIDVNCQNTRNGPIGSTFDIEVYLTAAGGTFAGNELNPAAWTQVATGQGVSLAQGTPTNVDITDFLVTPGQYGMSVYYTFSGGSPGTAFAYTNGVMTFSNADLRIDTGSSSGNGLFTGVVFSPRSWNGTIYYTPAMNAALATPYGSGCGGDGPATFYELFDGGNPNDLPGTGVTLNWTGTSYVVTQGASGIVTPSGAPTPFTDDQTQQFPLPFGAPFPTQLGGTNDIWVCSNGFIALTATTAAPFVESVQGLLTSPGLFSIYWDDFNPAAGGSIFVEQDPTNANLVHVTWQNVPQFGNTDSNTFQVSLNAGGSAEFKWGTMSSTDGLVGYSPGGGVADPGGTDISMITALPLGTGRPNLALVPVTRPVLGTTAMTRTDNIPAGSPAGFLVYGFNQINPGISLAPLGAPGCEQYLSLDASSLFIPTGSSETHNFGVPNNPVFIGNQLFVQTAAVAQGINNLNIITTNGVAWTLDVN